jgi:hypothetical protein
MWGLIGNQIIYYDSFHCQAVYRINAVVLISMILKNI